MFVPRPRSQVAACALAALLAVSGCSPRREPAEASEGAPGAPGLTVTRGAAATVACFPADLVDDEGQPVTCELSAAATLGDRVVVFNDKPVPGPDRSPVLTLDPKAPGAPAYVVDPVFSAFRKYEDAAELPDGRILVTTGFDRIRDDAAWDGFNGLLAWRPDAAVEVLAPSTRDGVTSSKRLRASLSKALADEEHPEGPTYFKVEGLAVLTDGRVLFGIRELGESYQRFAFAVTILAAPGIDALDEITRVWDYDPTQHPDIGRPLGLSGLGQDAARDGVWLTTSYEVGETDEDLGGYLWWLSREALDAGRAPVLARDANGVPYAFAHKPEAVTVLADGRLQIVHDDDRVTGRPASAITDPARQFSRALHESATEIIDVAAGGP